MRILDATTCQHGREIDSILSLIENYSEPFDFEHDSFVVLKPVVPILFFTFFHAILAWYLIRRCNVR